MMVFDIKKSNIQISNIEIQKQSSNIISVKMIKQREITEIFFYINLKSHKLLPVNLSFYVYIQFKKSRLEI